MCALDTHLPVHSKASALPKLRALTKGQPVPCTTKLCVTCSWHTVEAIACLRKVANAVLNFATAIARRSRCLASRPESHLWPMSSPLQG